MARISSIFTVLVATLSVTRCNATYTLKNNYQGKTFFDTFSFFTASDPTNGFVDYVDRTTALNKGYIGLSNHSLANDSIYIGVDHTSSASNAGRQSVRITSNATWTHALLAIDIYHMPTGCGLWPALWLVAPEGIYPGTTGEIDIIEGVHNLTANAMTLHTSDGCAVSNSTGASFQGTLNTANCFVDAPHQSQNSGCSIAAAQVEIGGGATATTAPAAGEAFNAQHGGVYALLWTSEVVEVYFFPRTSVPPALSAAANAAGAPDPSAWPAMGYRPLAQFRGCDFDAHLRDLALVVDTDFCGGWAGGTWNSSGCAKTTGVGSCESFVKANPGAFGEAYWLLGGVRVWQDE